MSGNTVFRQLSGFRIVGSVGAKAFNQQTGPEGLYPRQDKLPADQHGFSVQSSLGSFASPAFAGLEHLALGTQSSARRSGGLRVGSARTHVSLAGSPEDCVLRHLVYAEVPS